MKKILATAMTCALVAGCGPKDMDDETGCVTLGYPEACTGNPNLPKVTINRNTLKVSPPRVCANSGTTLEITLVPTPEYEPGDTVITPKAAENDWLQGDNSGDKNLIEIEIPLETGTDEYDYKVDFSDGKCIDPRVDVTRVAALEMMEEAEPLPEPELQQELEQ